MGLFDELDVASAADNPWAIPDDTYQAVVSDVVVKKNKKGNMGMTITYKIQGGDYDGHEVTEYKRMPHSSDADKLNAADSAKALSYIKQRLASLDIPEDRMNSVGKDDLVGIDCYIRTQQNGDFTNVNNVTREGPAGATAGTGTAGANPFV